MITDETVSRIRSGDAIAIIWSIDDVLSCTENEDGEETLTEEQAREVLQYVLDNHDSSWGVSWETIMGAAETLYPYQDKE